jgi:BirA family biotin operon repressor/biotin-[acetyl-CoA-carboxylase] ligase
MVRTPLESTAADLQAMRAALNDLHLGGFRYYSQVASTNDLAINWAIEKAEDMSLILADEQSNGRGRNGSKWFSAGKASLTFSLVVRPKKEEFRSIGFFTALAALAVIQAIQDLLNKKIKPEIKWPNDILVNGRKVCGILTEATWIGNDLASLVIGVGVNISAEAVPSIENIKQQATSLEQEAKVSIDRIHLLHQILLAINDWRIQLGSSEFMSAWEESLAYVGKRVIICPQNGRSWTGIIQGLDQDGGLRVLNDQGESVSLHDGEVHLELPGS